MVFCVKSPNLQKLWALRFTPVGKPFISSCETLNAAETGALHERSRNNATEVPRGEGTRKFSWGVKERGGITEDVLKSVKLCILWSFEKVLFGYGCCSQAWLKIKCNAPTETAVYFIFGVIDQSIVNCHCFENCYFYEVLYVVVLYHTKPLKLINSRCLCFAILCPTSKLGTLILVCIFY